MLRTLFFLLFVTLLYVVLPSLATRPDVYAIAIEECEGGASKCAKIQVIGEMKFFKDEEEDNILELPDDDGDDDEKDKDEDYEIKDEDKDEDEEEDDSDLNDVYYNDYDEYHNEIPTLKKYTDFGVDGSKNSKTTYTSAGHRNIQPNPIGELMGYWSRGISDIRKTVEQPKRHFIKRGRKTTKASKIDEEKIPIEIRRILGVNSGKQKSGR